MPASQYARHALHCAFGSTSSISHSSVFPAALTTFCDSSLKGLNARCCWRSLWSACRWGCSESSESSCERWRNVIVSLSNSALLECWSQCFPRRLHGLNSLSALNDAMSRCSAGTNCSFTMCVLALDFTGLPVLSEESSSFVQTFIIDPLVNGTFFLYPEKTRSMSSGFLDRSQIGLGLDCVGLESLTRGASPKDCWTSFPNGCCSTVEPNWSFPLLQLWSCLNEIFGGGRRDKYGLSYKTSPVFKSFNLECNKLEVSLEEKLHSIVFDRMLILLWSKDEYQPRRPRLDASSMHCARTAFDVEQRSQYVQDLCHFRL